MNEIITVDIPIKGNSVRMTVKEAKDLHSKLSELLGMEYPNFPIPYPGYPVYPNYPTPINVPVQPYYPWPGTPIITCKDS